METCFNYCSKEHGYFSSDEKRFINRIRKLKEKYPDQVLILVEPEENNGCIYCQLPSEWLKVSPPVVRNFSEEQRAEMSARMKQVHNASSES